MEKEIRARFSPGKLEPLEEVDLEEGTVVRAIVPDPDKGEKIIAALLATAGAGQGTYDPEELRRNIYAERLV